MRGRFLEVSLAVFFDDECPILELVDSFLGSQPCIIQFQGVHDLLVVVEESGLGVFVVSSNLRFWILVFVVDIGTADIDELLPQVFIRRIGQFRRTLALGQNFKGLHHLALVLPHQGVRLSQR